MSGLRTVGCRISAAAILAVSAAFAEAPAPEGDARAAATGESAAIRIGLPEGNAGPFELSLGEGRLILDLPAGCGFPLDFVSASNGLLRGGEVTPQGEERVRLELRIASGWFEGLAFDGSALLVRFGSRASALPSGDTAEGQYRLGVDDKIQVTVAGHPELSRQVAVGGSGTITVPLVGEVTAAGLTVSELSSKLADLYARDYLVDPNVDAEVVEFKSQWVLVTGEVRIPGRVALRGGSTLKDVLADGGGLGPDAGEEIVITRASKTPGGGTENLEISRKAFDLGEANPPVLHGDMINVRSVSYVYLQGEVRNSGRVRVEHGLTLLKAIALVGGLTEWANRKEVQVMHEGSDEPTVVYNLKDIERLRIPDPPLKGGEIVIVKRRFL